MTEKHDVFVGNVTFNTTEEQLREIFVSVGPIKNIRILQDKDSGRPKGFAFIEYHDANTALAAIRHLDQSELNGRKLRVSYSNNSNLKDLAKQIGLEVVEPTASSRSEFLAVSSLHLHEAWEVLSMLKTMAEEDKGAKLRALLEAYPSLGVAIQQIQRRLGIISNVMIPTDAPATNTTTTVAPTLGTAPSLGAPLLAPTLGAPTLGTAPLLAPTLAPTLGGSIAPTLGASMQPTAPVLGTAPGLQTFGQYGYEASEASSDYLHQPTAPQYTYGYY